MNAHEIRNAFLIFFEKKQHKVELSAPIVVKDDPTLMFTNAGMNPFKELFLGNTTVKHKRICNSQKCLRVSGKHNDLEEVGYDTYHHTMFEMLGNWSFGNYFKKEAIEWAWEFLVTELHIDKKRLYVTVFEGNKEDSLLRDEESYNYWLQYLPKERILGGSKKDNFWEMGDTGPCGPCSEIHIDLRSADERTKKEGTFFVNKDHPQVIEIWNLVFIQYNRKTDKTLEPLRQKHVDTGMGFERLCRVLQNKNSNYDTDIFQPLICKISEKTGIKYGENQETDVAMRIISDHLRAVTFSIADGQLPSNNKAGYVIRRILRRATRYAYTFLNRQEAFIYTLLEVLIEQMGGAYPEILAKKKLIEKVIKEEEQTFLRTLETGIRLLHQIIKTTQKENYKIISGKTAFKLYDTYGFPLDLTELIVKEHNLIVNRKEFDENMKAQQNRSKIATSSETGDWVYIHPDDVEEFVGYDYNETKVKITRYRKVKQKKKELYQLVFNLSPFYAEGGGQVGDTGYIEANAERTTIFDTKNDNGLIVHFTQQLPQSVKNNFYAVVNKERRQFISCNHTATHLLHYALRQILGNHVEQQGSLVTPDYLRFDFNHFKKLTDHEIKKVEQRVNALIRQNSALDEKREIPITEAKEMGAMSLFGEKYKDVVRVIKYNNSVELCAGTHVKATGEIGWFTIISESSIAAGIRRIEAKTNIQAEKYISQQLDILEEVKKTFNNPANIKFSIQNFVEKNNELQKKIEIFVNDELKRIKNDLIDGIKSKNGINVIAHYIKELHNPEYLKKLSFQLKGEVENIFLILGLEAKGKAQISIMISDNLVKEKDLKANELIKGISKYIGGGGGGQAFYATAGGKNPNGIEKAIDQVVKKVFEH